MRPQIIVIGGGVSGLSLAWRACECGAGVCVLESDKVVGGLAKTIREDGYCMDVGPHSFFSEDTQIVNTVLALFHGALKPCQRRVKFYYRGKYLNYPLTAFSVLFQMGIWSGIRSAMSFLKCKMFPRKRARADSGDETVEEWALNSFGEHLYRTFFKPYTEQFWKVSCADLSSRSIPFHTRTNFANTLRMLLKRRYTDGTSLVEREMLPTYYPDSGFGEIAEAIADAARKAGADIRLGCRVVGVERLRGGLVRVSYECDGGRKEIEGSHLVSTIPLNQFVKMLTPPVPAEVLAAAGRLDYRSLVALGMVTEKQHILRCAYIYVLNRPYNRISEMNEFSPSTSPRGNNILVVEMPCLKGSPAWNASADELFNMCIGSLSEDGFIAPGDVERLLLIKEPCAYPIYRKDYATNLNRVLDYLGGSEGISTLGRAGEFMYMDVDICMRRAFDFAARLLSGYQPVS